MSTTVVIIRISEYIKQNISENYIFIRYMGPKFVIAFSGVEKDGVADFLNEIKEQIEKLEISLEDDIEILEINQDENSKERKTKKSKKKVPQVAVPRLNFVISSYHKGTGLEEVLKKLENYLNNADKNESEINNI